MKSFRNTTLGLAGRLAVRCGLARVVRRFSSDEQGAAAIEFGIVAIPFFALLFAIIETALTFFAGQALETAVSNASRLIRTGQAQQLGLTASGFKDLICGQVEYLLDCNTGVYVDVKRYATFGDITLPRPIGADGNLNVAPNTYTYEPGGGGDIVVVRAFYEWPVWVNKLGNNMGDLSNGKHLLAATAAFRNEPFPW